MKLTLRADIEDFIDEQVKAGRFPTPEAVVEAAVTHMKQVDPELDDATINAINEAEDQADRGEGVDIDTFRAQLNLRHTGN